MEQNPVVLLFQQFPNLSYGLYGTYLIIYIQKYLGFENYAVLLGIVLIIASFLFSFWL